MKQLRPRLSGAVSHVHDPSRRALIVDRHEQRFDLWPKSACGFDWREVSQRIEIVHRKTRDRLCRGQRHRAALGHFVHEALGDGVGRIQIQHRGERTSRLGKPALFQIATCQACPRPLIGGIAAGDLKVYFERLDTEAVVLRQLDRTLLQIHQVIMATNTAGLKIFLLR